MTKNGKLQKKDVGIHAYFSGFEYADGWVYVDTHIFKKVYNMKLCSMRACRYADKRFKELTMHKNINDVLENLDEILNEIWL